MNPYSKIQYISQGSTLADQYNNIHMALEKGVKWIQLRWKEGNLIDIQQLGWIIKDLCRKYQAKLIINDHIAIAAVLDADGVHLGLQDDTIAYARKRLGKNKIIGATANTLPDILKHIQHECDYIGLGPFRFTENKKNLSPILGLDGYQSIFTELIQISNCPPIYAIGGIQEEDIQELLKVGVYGIAASSLIHQLTTKDLQEFNLRYG
jgi:thiamine-phosphate pyrophosphorylase